MREHRRPFILGPFLYVILQLLTAIPAARAQPASPEPPGPRSFTVSGGIGNDFGGFGVQAEAHMFAERASILGAAGYAPGPETSGVLAFAAGIRGYLPGVRHRFYGSVSYAPLVGKQEGTWIPVDFDLFIVRWSEPEYDYGPALSVGYQYTALGGFTAQVGAGVGYADERARFVLDLGAGYTFGR